MLPDWIKSWRKPRLGIGHILTSIAVASLPLAVILPAARGVTSVGGIVFVILFCLVGIFESEFLFWYVLRPLVYPSVGQCEAVDDGPNAVSFLD